MPTCNTRLDPQVPLPAFPHSSLGVVPMTMDPPVSRRYSTVSACFESSGMPHPSHPVRRGRKPSRVLYPPLGRKRAPREEADPAKRWLVFFFGLMLLQILMEEPGQELPGSSTSPWHGAPVSTASFKSLLNSSGDDLPGMETSPDPFASDLGRKPTLQDTALVMPQTFSSSGEKGS